MKSKISIDVDWDNQPIIKIEYEDSPDVRDKLVKRFMEAFGGGSCWASFYFDQSVSEMTDKVNRKAKIRPIEPYRIHEQIPLMQESINNQPRTVENAE